MATIASPLAGVFSTPPPPPGVAAPASSEGGGSDSSGWLTGLGDLFQGIGSVVISGIQASNAPAAPTPGSGWVYNPTTGTYHDPATGRALTSTGTLTSAGASNWFSNPIVIFLAVLLGFVVLKPLLKKE
jgi:hypothetical protein